MDATPSFGVTMISEEPSNPQLTLNMGASGASNFPFKNKLGLVLNLMENPRKRK